MIQSVTSQSALINLQVSAFTINTNLSRRTCEGGRGDRHTDLHNIYVIVKPIVSDSGSDRIIWQLVNGLSWNVEQMAPMRIITQNCLTLHDFLFHFCKTCLDIKAIGWITWNLAQMVPLSDIRHPCTPEGELSLNTITSVSSIYGQIPTKLNLRSIVAYRFLLGCW